MTSLARLLENVGTMRKCLFTITKYTPKAYVLTLEDLEFGTLANPTQSKKATGSAETLEGAADSCLASALRCGLIDDPCPPTEPGGDHGR